MNVLNGIRTNCTHSFTNLFPFSCLSLLLGQLVPLIGTHQLRPSSPGHAPSDSKSCLPLVDVIAFLSQKDEGRNPRWSFFIL